MTKYRHDHSVQIVKDINAEDREESSKEHESSTDKNQWRTLETNFVGAIQMHLLVVCDALSSGMFLQKQHPFINHLAWALKMCKHQ